MNHTNRCLPQISMHQFDQPMDQSINRPTDQPPNQPINQPIHPPVNPPINPQAAQLWTPSSAGWWVEYSRGGSAASSGFRTRSPPWTSSGSSRRCPCRRGAVRSCGRWISGRSACKASKATPVRPSAVIGGRFFAFCVSPYISYVYVYNRQQ